MEQIGASGEDGFLTSDAHVWFALFLALPLPIAAVVWLLYAGPAIAIPAGLVASMSVLLAARGLRILRQRSSQRSVDHLLAAALAAMIVFGALAVLFAAHTAVGT